MATPHPDRWRRVATVVAAAALFVVPFLVASPGSATIIQPVSVVTTVNGVQGGTATAGAVTSVSMQITNKATNGAKLGLFTIVLPAGATGLSNLAVQPSNWNVGALSCGSTPRCSALLFANATRASAFLPPGATATVTFQMTAANPGTLSLPLLGIGGGLFFATSTPTITVVPAAPPAALQITSITEGGAVLPILNAGQTFNVAFKVVDASGNLVTSPNVTVSLSAPGLDPLLASLKADPVTSSNGVGVISAVYLGPSIKALGLQLTSGSLTSPTTTVDIDAAGVSVSLTPGQNVTITIGDVTLPTGAAIAKLTNGAVGQVDFSIGACVADPTSDCLVNGQPALSEISLSADFDELYNDQAPAEMDWQCSPDATPRCAPPPLNDGETRYALQQAEFKMHPVKVAPSNGDGTFGKAVPAPACGATDGGFSFCVDVQHIDRSKAQCDDTCTAWDGILTIPVLFVNDPRFYIG